MRHCYNNGAEVNEILHCCFSESASERKYKYPAPQKTHLKKGTEKAGDEERLQRQAKKFFLPKEKCRKQERRAQEWCPALVAQAVRRKPEE